MGDGLGAVPWCEVLVRGRRLDAANQQAKQVAISEGKEGAT